MKYYTPELEEFFPGFEFEESFEEKWYKRICWRGDYPKLFDEDTDYETEYRVKYLDEQDIKDLGWQQDENYPTQYYLKDSDFVWTLVDFEDFINIETSSRHVNFNVTIKNKGELKKLMKQLGII